MVWWLRFFRSRRVQRAAGVMVAQYLRFVRKTSSLVIEPADIYERVVPDLPVIIAMWHGQHLMMPFLKRPGFDAKALISWHGGGEMNAVAAERLGIGAIRGAGDHEGRFVHKGGLGGFKAMLSTLSDGFNVALTTDFPKVARVAGSGTVMLARESGRPIYPVAAAASPRFELGNWDRTVISLPWSRIAIVVGEPIRVPADAEKAGMEEARRAVEEALNAVTARAYEIVDSRQENRLAHAGRVPDAAVMGSRNCDARSEPRIQ